VGKYTQDATGPQIHLLYSLPVPTPFYHLRLARELLAADDCPPLLAGQAPAFYLGNIAPDTQTLTGQTREATHFFDVPMRDLTPAWHTLFRQHPGLADSAKHPAAHAAFLTGYLCHLALDQLWISHVFDPVFGEAAPWSNFRHRLFMHNVLRIYLDELDRPFLRNGVADSLACARPQRWLPFLTDEALGRWRDFVAGQLADGGEAQTIEVFAKRMGLPPDDFTALLESPAAMQAQLFDRISLSALDDFRAHGLALSREVIAEYLHPEGTDEVQRITK